jgi:hypothetical protein
MLALDVLLLAQHDINATGYSGWYSSHMTRIGCSINKDIHCKWYQLERCTRHETGERENSVLVITTKNSESLIVEFKVEIIIAATSGLRVIRILLSRVICYYHFNRLGHDAPEPLVAELQNQANIFSRSLTPFAATESMGLFRQLAGGWVKPCDDLATFSRDL